MFNQKNKKFYIKKNTYATSKIIFYITLCLFLFYPDNKTIASHIPLGELTHSVKKKNKWKINEKIVGLSVCFLAYYIEMKNAWTLLLWICIYTLSK